MERLRRSSPAAAAALGGLIREHIPILLLRRWPLTWALLHLAGSALGGWAADDLPWAGRTLPVGYAGLVRLAACLPLLVRSRFRAVQAVVWGLVLGVSFFAGAIETGQRRARPAATAERPWSAAVELGHEGAAVIRTTGWAQAGRADSWRAPARLVAWSPADAGSGGPQVGEGLLVRGTGPLPPPGALRAGPLRVTVPARAALPAGFDYRAFLSGRGLRWTARFADPPEPLAEDRIARLGRIVIDPVRSAILLALADLFPRREAELAAAVLLGRRTADSREAAEPFSDLGLAHLFSVSGLHVGILLGMILLPGRWLALPPSARLLPLALTLPLYVVLTGMPGSVLRAAGLGWLAAGAVAAGRRSDALHLVGCLFWLGSLWDPWQNLDTGLRLSYLAAGGILALSSGAERSGLLGGGPLKWIAAGVSVSLAAQWFTLPVVACSFGRISLLSPLANLIAVPLFGVALWLVVLALVAGAACPWLGQAIAAWAWLILRTLAGGVQLGSEATGGWTVGLPVPGPVRIALLAVLSAALLGWVQGWLGTGWSLSRRRVAIGLALVVGFGGIAPWRGANAPAATCWFFDVGQGDCLFVEMGDGWTALIDTAGRFGRSPRRTARWRAACCHSWSAGGSSGSMLPY